MNGDTLHALIAVAGPAIGIIFSWLTYGRNSRRDAEEGVRREAILSTKVDEIIKRLVVLETHDERLARVEESAKAAHRRLDEYMQAHDK